MSAHVVDHPDWLLAADEFFACTRPEAPYTSHMVFVGSCRPCWLMARAAELQGFGSERRHYTYETISDGVREMAAKYGHEIAP